MGKDAASTCPRHPGDVRVELRTLHSDHLAPGQVLGVYVCPDCGYERRLPIETRTEGGAPSGSPLLLAEGGSRVP